MKIKLLTTLIISTTLFSYSDDTKRATSIGNPSGRYAMGSIDGTYLGTFLLDTETGRVWKVYLDEERKTSFFGPFLFHLADGSPSLVPIDTDKEIELVRAKSKARQSGGTNSPPVQESPSSYLPKDFKLRLDN